MNSTVKSMIVVTCVVLGAFASARAGEIWVDQNTTAAKATGTKDAPFKTVGEAVKAAVGGDVITIRKGVYRESVQIAKGGTAEQPTVLRAAPGERVVMSGFAPIEKWEAQADGVFSATVDGNVSDLYVGYRPQPVVRWPDPDEPMRLVKDPNAEAGTFVDAALPKDNPALKAVADQPMSAMLFLYVRKYNGYTSAPIKSLDLGEGKITLADPKRAASLEGKGDRFQIINHPKLIKKPGEWAVEKLAAGGTKVYFKPGNPEDLKSTQYRKLTGRLVGVAQFQAKPSYVRIESLEVCGSADEGITVGKTDHVTITHCFVHNNEGVGIQGRGTSDLTLSNNLVLANGNGVSVVSSERAVVENNEIALNMVDGLVIAGNVSGRPGGEAETNDVTCRRNYVHHHLLMGHPDNMQTYRGVHKLTIEDTVLLLGGQAVMTEQTDTCTIRNSIVAGTSAVALIFGHSSSHDWTVENSTVGMGGWGIFSFTDKGYAVFNNILFDTAASLSDEVKSDNNVFWRSDPSLPIASVSKPKHQVFGDVAAMSKARGGQDAASVRADPKFRNAPVTQAVADGNDADKRDTLHLRGRGPGTGTAAFAVGDVIECNGDGVARKVTAVNGDAIQFEPALPAKPFRDVLIWNWKKATSLELDLRPAEGSPALTAGKDKKPAGSSIDIPAYKKGDFDGDGKRDIPEIPEDVKAGLPNPNNVVVPMQGA